MSRPPNRERQKKRTRTALLDAAARLVAEGQRPSVAEVAEAAEISRRTAYRYFPTQQQLLVEATLEALKPKIEGAVVGTGLGGPSEPVADRLDRAVRVVQRETVANEALLRAMIRLTVGGEGDETEHAERVNPPRGYRRLRWIELALEPVRTTLGPRRFKRLVNGVSLCVGIEALLVLRDVCGLDVEEAQAVSRWAARALLDASLEAASRSSSPRRGS